MKEFPLLFTAEMVRAYLEGRKTQTRRIPTPYNSTIDGPTCNLKLWKTLDWTRATPDPGPSPAGNPGPYWKVPSTLGTTHRVYCRYQVGDRLWGKETIALETWTREYGDVPPIPKDRPHFHNKGGENEWDGEYWEWPHYRATDPEPELDYGWGDTCAKCEDGDPHAHWIPSIHMPKWAGRIDLEVVSITAQRLHRMGEISAKAEGVTPKPVLSVPRGGEPYDSYCEAYADLWDKINGKRGFGWDKNPPVWVIEFPVYNAAALQV